MLDYCESDVVSLMKLLPAMGPDIDIPRAVIRGRYMAAAARMEWAGVPIDADALAAFQDNWATVKEKLIARIDLDYGVYDGTTFKADRWAACLAANNIPWPTLSSGKLKLDDDTFKEMARSYTLVAPIRELRATMSQFRLNVLPVGSDGRNRCLLSAYGSKTGRNQPSNSKFIFGLPSWSRSLIRPNPGMAVAYIDYSQQELAIAAALSGDRKMQVAYESGDFYLTFAKMANAVPADATKKSHAAERDQFKSVGAGCAVRPVGQRVGPEAERPPVPRPRSAANAQGDVPAILGVVRCRSGPGNPRGQAPDRVRLDGPRRQGHQRPQLPELPDAGERG